MTETLYVVERPAGTEWVAGKGAREQPLWDERVGNESEAHSLLESDPWCSDGRDVQGVGRIRPWTIFLDGR